MRRTFSNILLMNQVFPEFVGPQTMNERFVCIGSHHLNMTIICLVQNVFQKGKIMRTLSLNTHYFVLYKNRRDQEQIQRFGREAFPQQSK
jgi:hypothetical protein